MRDFKSDYLPDPDRFTRRIEELLGVYQTQSPLDLAAATGSVWVAKDLAAGVFHLAYWEREVSLNYPTGSLSMLPTGETGSAMDRTLLLYYFTLADGTPSADEWISFGELPDGKIYNQAFQGYTGNELSRAFGDRIDAFRQAAESLGGERQSLGDASFRFCVLPRIDLLVVYWLGDEDFPSSAQVLFDRSASHYLTTDSFAILGSTISRRLIAANQIQE